MIECCANSITSALIGIKAGANRIELCADLQNGGVTPKYSEIKKLRDLTSIDLHVLILPIANKFSYSKKDLKKIVADIEFCKKIGVEGVVVGAINKDKSIDITTTKKMVDVARPMKVTFHRAFDKCSDLQNNLEDIIKTGCDYLLTSGQCSDVNEGLKNIAQLIKMAKNRVTILAGGGVNHNNISKLYETGVRQFHLSGSSTNKFGETETNFNLIQQAVKAINEINEKSN
ncbi:MAG: copper homeostasis protein CutC [Flavobacteriales bacterium]|nr:copper homeostasis protein CutC [Flavobacteriales bacterium]